MKKLQNGTHHVNAVLSYDESTITINGDKFLRSLLSLERLVHKFASIDDGGPFSTYVSVHIHTTMEGHSYPICTVIKTEFYEGYTGRLIDCEYNNSVEYTDWNVDIMTKETFCMLLCCLDNIEYKVFEPLDIC